MDLGKVIRRDPNRALTGIKGAFVDTLGLTGSHFLAAAARAALHRHEFALFYIKLFPGFIGPFVESAPTQGYAVCLGFAGTAARFLTLGLS